MYTCKFTTLCALFILTIYISKAFGARVSVAIICTYAISVIGLSTNRLLISLKILAMD